MKPLVEDASATVNGSPEVRTFPKCTIGSIDRTRAKHLAFYRDDFELRRVEKAQLKNIGILLSGRGSNFEAIANNVSSGKISDARIAVVISNRSDAGGIETARKLGLDAIVIPSKGKAREDHDREVVSALQQRSVDLVCLAGYMRLLSPWFVKQFPQRILNIHPSLLPAFPGLEAQEQAFAYGVKIAGCTVHFVDEELDHGAIIVQKQVPVLDSDDEHSLAARILEQEHIAYSEAINIVLNREWKVGGRRFLLSE